MRILAGLILGLLVVGCGKKEAKSETETETQTLEGKAGGKYHDPDDPDAGTFVLCKEGHPPGAPKAVEEWGRYGEKHKKEGEWSVKNGEIHINWPYEDGIGICLLNSDGNLQLIAIEENGKRTDFSIEDQPPTFKKIKQPN